MKFLKVLLIASCLVVTGACSNDDDNNNDQANNTAGTNEAPTPTPTPGPTGTAYKWASVRLEDLSMFPPHLAITSCQRGVRFTIYEDGKFAATENCTNDKRSGEISDADLQSLDTLMQNISLKEAQSKLKCVPYENGTNGYFTRLSMRTEAGSSYVLLKDGTTQICFTEPRSDTQAILEKVYALRMTYL